MNRLPAGWRQVALRDAGTWFGGGTPSKARPEFWADGTVPWLSPKDMGADVIASTRDSITEVALSQSAARLVPSGSVAIVVRSGILERTVPVAVVPFATALNQDMKALAPRDDIDPRWIAWALRSIERHLLDQCRKAGTTVASLDTRRLLDVQIPVAPPDEQRRIVEILEDHLSRLDAAGGYLGLARTRSARLRQSVLTDAYALASGDPGARLRALGEVVADGRRIAYGVLVPGPHVDGGVPMVRVGDLRGGVVETGALKHVDRSIAAAFPRTQLTGGEVLLSVVGTIGRVGVATPDLIGANVARAVAVLPIKPEIDPAFLSLVLQEPRVQRELNQSAHEVARKTLNLEDVRRFAIPVPPLDTQRRIAQTTTSLFEGLDRIDNVAQLAEIRAGALHRSLLGAAFSGRLTGRSSDVDRVEELAGV